MRLSMPAAAFADALCALYSFSLDAYVYAFSLPCKCLPCAIIFIRAILRFFTPPRSLLCWRDFSRATRYAG